MNTPKSLCQRGCGKPAPIAKQTDTRLGYVAGQPKRFIYGHHQRHLRLPIPTRFWSKVNKLGPKQPHMSSRCWLWTGARTGKQGTNLLYGHMNVGNRKYKKATHLAIFLRTGQWPAPKPNQVRHKCDVPLCVRWSHLAQGTAQDDANDKVARNRQQKGSQITGAKRTSAEIARVKRRLRAGVRQAQVCRETGIDTATMSLIARGRMWKHVR